MFAFLHHQQVPGPSLLTPHSTLRPVSRTNCRLKPQAQLPVRKNTSICNRTLDAISLTICFAPQAPHHESYPQSCSHWSHQHSGPPHVAASLHGCVWLLRQICSLQKLLPAVHSAHLLPPGQVFNTFAPQHNSRAALTASQGHKPKALWTGPIMLANFMSHCSP